MADQRNQRGGRRRPADRPNRPSRSVDRPRRVAFDLLRAVDRGAYANLEMPRLLRSAGLTGTDAAFATELGYGSLRLRGRYDPIIERAAGRPVGMIDPPVLDVLRLGAHQVLGMRVPSHAAASETVELARSVSGQGAAGFTNAVLRRITEHDLDHWLREVTAGMDRDPDEALAIEISHPAWQVRAFRAALVAHGAATAETADAELRALLEADNTPAAVTLVARPGLCTIDELEEAGATPAPLATTAATLTGGDPGRIAAVRQTRAAVQDEGSQLLALALAAARDQTRSDRTAGDQTGGDQTGGSSEEWLDLCAGPGGKTALLATLGAQQGATVFANEISEHRTELVRRTLRATLDAGIEVMIGTGDGRELGREEPDTYDRVLVDAPCTGLGALRRRPEARWRRTPADLPDLARLQLELLLSAIDATKPGGIVAYSTCSPHFAETVVVVEQAMSQRPEIVAIDAREFFTDRGGAPIERLGSGPYVQLWPHIHGTDAMFLALLRKPAAAPNETAERETTEPVTTEHPTTEDVES